MSIACQCPYCAKHYKLKDALAGKEVNCNNPNCGKSFNVPKLEAVGVGPKISQAELDALAIAAFSDEPLQEKAQEQQLEVVCTGCDHKWLVPLEKEGKNVPCPECRKVIRVPMRVKDKKADWRGGNDSGPSYRKREEAPEVAGAIDAGKVGGISDKGAREYLRMHEEPEEPSVVRKRWAKRIGYGLLAVSVVGFVGYKLATMRKEGQIDTAFTNAIKEVTEEQSYANAKQFHAVVHRGMAEVHSRDAKSQTDYEDVLNNFKSARNAIKGLTADHIGMLVEIATSTPDLLEAGTRADQPKSKVQGDFLKETRQTLTNSSDQPDVLHGALRTIIRKLVEKEQTELFDEIASMAAQLGKGDAVGQVGLELVRLNKKAEAEAIFNKNANDPAPSIIGLRMALGKQPPKGKEGPTPTRIADSEAAALQGDYAKAKSRATAGQTGKVDEMPRALMAVAHALPDTQADNARDAISEAYKKLTSPDAKGQVAPWVVIRACRLLAKLGKPDEADKLADTLPDAQTKAWGKLEALRGKLLQAKTGKGEELWLDAVGDPAKSVAAAKACEELARHNAKEGHSYQATVKGWTSGTKRPFGATGLILGQQDRDGK